jgi:replicative DNA helicase
MQTPPNNTEAERAVLGSILLDTTNRNADGVMDSCLMQGITPEAFYDNRNATIFDSLLMLNRLSKPLDPVTLMEELRVTNKLDAIGGAGYVQALLDQCATTAYASHYISIIRAKYLRSCMITNANTIISKCFEEDKNPDVGALLGEAEKSFLDIQGNKISTMSWDAAIELSRASIDQMFDSDGHSLQGLPTGLQHLDEKLQGLKNAEMVVIAARPSVGKTSLAMNIAECCALGEDITGMPFSGIHNKKHPVLIFSLEMPIEQLSKRMIAGRAKINVWKLNRALYSSRDQKTLTANLFSAAESLKQAPIYVDDAAYLDVSDMRARARRWKKTHGIELIVIDYLQLLHCAEAAKQGRVIEVSMISQQIKAMAKELNVPVIVLSQLSRANEKRTDKTEKPKLSDLRDSGAIEQDADVVFLLRRPSRTASDPESEDKRLAIIDVAKNRNGETGEVRVDFDGEFTRFTNRPIESNSDSGSFTPMPPPEQSEFGRIRYGSEEDDAYSD